MTIQQRLLKFVVRSNWILFIAASILAGLASSPEFTKGIVFGGLIVTVNFHALARTLQKALTPPYLSSHTSVLAKYYIRFIISGVILFFLISRHIVNPMGLFVGLSVVVASIMLATINEVTKIIFKEAV
ncbi:MAG: ATP synthase subunit I [Thermodesulfobacteriota bacterium]